MLFFLSTDFSDFFMQVISRFEKARLLSARALQLALGAPPLVKHDKEKSMYEMAKKELAEKALPISVMRVFPDGRTEEINIF